MLLSLAELHTQTHKPIRRPITGDRRQRGLSPSWLVGSAREPEERKPAHCEDSRCRCALIGGGNGKGKGKGCLLAAQNNGRAQAHCVRRAPFCFPARKTWRARVRNRNRGSQSAQKASSCKLRLFVRSPDRPFARPYVCLAAMTFTQFRLHLASLRRSLSLAAPPIRVCLHCAALRLSRGCLSLSLSLSLCRSLDQLGLDSGGSTSARSDCLRSESDIARVVQQTHSSWTQLQSNRMTFRRQSAICSNLSR